ncbi:putative ribonuclease H-like domain-containing protein [Tanacetum coccineum]
MVEECAKIIHEEEIWKEGVYHEVVEDKGNGDKKGNAKELVSIARPEVITARPDVDATRQEDSVVEPRTPPTTTNVDDSSRPERSILTLKPLPTIDPKDKGKGVLKESPVKKVKRSDLDAAQIAKDVGIARLIHKKELAEMEREREERQRQDQASMDYILGLYDEVQAKMDASEELATSAASTPIGVNTSGSSYVYLGGQIPIDASTLPNVDLPIDPNMPDLEDDSNVFPNDGIFSGAYDDEDVGVEANFNNMDNTIDILVDLPFGKKAIGTKWVFRNKRDKRSIVVKNKARLIAQGFRPEEGIDYDEVFVPVARIEAISLFLAFASFMGFPVYQLNVKSAFLYGTIRDEVYVHQPPGFVDPAHPNKVYKVIKALYGLHQAPRAWYETLSSFLLEHSFRRGTIDKTLFIKKNKSDIMLVQVYVDDIIFGSTMQSICTEFEDCMHKRFQMSSMGELTFFSRLQVKQQPDGIFISQDKYVADILKKFDFCSIKTATTPIESNKPLVKDEDGIDVDVHVYRSMIGSLMYLTASRPDIMFAVCACARFQVTPKASHLNAVKRIFRYLKHQPKLGLWYLRDSPFELEAFSDSNYGGASLNRKSTTAANCYGQVLWIQNQMMDYGFNFMNTKIHINNESTICIVKNLVYHSRTKHIEIQHHFIRDYYEKRLIDVIKIHTDANVADLLTKGFNVTRFNFLVDKHEFEDGWKLCCLQVNSGSLQVNTGRQKLILICHINTELKMANFRYSDKHNMVAFLKKPTESVGFTEIVDFLKGTSIFNPYGNKIFWKISNVVPTPRNP